MEVGDGALHEMSLMTQVFRIINETVTEKAEGLCPEVSKVVLKVGKMANAVPDALRFSFQVLSKDSICSKAELVIEEEPLLLECGVCGCIYGGDGLASACPGCGSKAARISRGTEIYIDRLEIEEGSKVPWKSK